MGMIVPYHMSWLKYFNVRFTHRILQNISDNILLQEEFWCVAERQAMTTMEWSAYDGNLHQVWGLLMNRALVTPLPPHPETVQCASNGQIDG